MKLKLKLKLKRINTIYFSPTGGTAEIVRFIARELAALLHLEEREIDLTRPENRKMQLQLGCDELLIMASPVYAGRLPNKLLPDYHALLHGEGTPAVAVCTFGNRSCDEALRELVMLLEGNNFHVAGAAAFACRHAFSERIGTGRPDGEDMAQMRQFAAHVADKLKSASIPPLQMNRGEIGSYYVPLRTDGAPAKFLKAKPKTNWEKCNHCGICARVCPLGSIDRESMEAVGLCIKCQACVHRCPEGAKYFDDPDFLSHVAMLEKNYIRRADHVILL